jgi:hypothetical protein
VKDPLSRGLVLPLARHEQIAHDWDRPGPAHTLRRRYGRREAEHLMATRHEYLDQLGADESVGTGDERDRPCVACHLVSVSASGAGHH